MICSQSEISRDSIENPINAIQEASKICEIDDVELVLIGSVYLVGDILNYIISRDNLNFWEELPGRGKKIVVRRNPWFLARSGESFSSSQKDGSANIAAERRRASRGPPEILTRDKTDRDRLCSSIELSLLPSTI